MALPPVYIYALCDPDTQDVRYIGRSVRPKHRLAEHHSTYALSRRSYKNAWLRSLVAAGKCATMQILEVADSATWPVAEQRWIAHYRAAGAPLTNLTAGGEGVLGWVCSAEMRRKRSILAKQRDISVAQAERWRAASQAGRTAESWAKAAAARRGRERPPEVMEKCASAKRGRPLTAEHRHKLVVSHLGKPHPHSEAAKRNMARAQHGRALPRHNSSGYKGVSWNKGVGRWYAYIPLDGKRRHLGVYHTAEEAARAYNDAARTLFGSFARLNDIPE